MSNHFTKRGNFGFKGMEDNSICYFVALFMHNDIKDFEYHKENFIEVKKKILRHKDIFCFICNYRYFVNKTIDCLTK